MIGAYLAAITVVLWAGLIVFGKDAPLGIWKCLFILPTAAVMLTLTLLILVGSFGTKEIELCVEDK